MEDLFVCRAEIDSSLLIILRNAKRKYFRQCLRRDYERAVNLHIAVGEIKVSAVCAQIFITKAGFDRYAGDLDGQFIYLFVIINIGVVAEDRACSLKRDIGIVAYHIAAAGKQSVYVYRSFGIPDTVVSFLGQRRAAEENAQQTDNEHECKTVFFQFTHITLLS